MYHVWKNFMQPCRFIIIMFTKTSELSWARDYSSCFEKRLMFSSWRSHLWGSESTHELESLPLDKTNLWPLRRDCLKRILQACSSLLEEVWGVLWESEVQNKFLSIKITNPIHTGQGFINLFNVFLFYGKSWPLVTRLSQQT